MLELVLVVALAAGRLRTGTAGRASNVERVLVTVVEAALLPLLLKAVT